MPAEKKYNELEMIAKESSESSDVNEENEEEN